MSLWDFLCIFNKFELKFLISIMSSKKLLCLIFYVYLFDFISLISFFNPFTRILVIFCLIGVIISGNIFFIATHVFVVNKICTNSDAECKKYLKQYNVQCARAGFIFSLSYFSYFYFMNTFYTFFN